MRIRQIALMALAAVTLAAPLCAGACSRGYSGPPEPVSIGTTSSEVNSLILIAEENGYFKANGIEITRDTYTSGAAAIGGMLKGEVDLVTGSEYAFAGQVLGGTDMVTVSAISRSSTEFLLARTDRGIAAPADLRGKKIGVPLESRPEFSLSRYLALNGIAVSEVTLVNVAVNQSVEALTSGAVDAVTTWEPYASLVREALNGGVVSWSTQQQQPSYSLLMAQRGWQEQHGPLLERLMRALSQAQNYTERNPAEARELVRVKLGYDEDYINAIWGQIFFNISLDHALVSAVEDEARWLIANKLTAAKTVPNFTDYIYSDALRAVKPEAVDIIG